MALTDLTKEQEDALVAFAKRETLAAPIRAELETAKVALAAAQTAYAEAQEDAVAPIRAQYGPVINAAQVTVWEKEAALKVDEATASVEAIP